MFSHGNIIYHYVGIPGGSWVKKNERESLASWRITQPLPQRAWILHADQIRSTGAYYTSIHTMSGQLILSIP